MRTRDNREGRREEGGEREREREVGQKEGKLNEYNSNEVVYFSATQKGANCIFFLPDSANTG